MSRRMTEQTTNIAWLQQELLYECGLDQTGLWEFVWMTAEELDLDDPDEVRAAVLESTSGLLKAGYIRAGVPKGRVDFDPWNLSPEEAIERIEREWDALGREPDIGEIVWFDITEKGREQLVAS